MGRGVRKWVAVVGEEQEGEGLSRVCTVPAYLQPREETGREGGMDSGMDKNACREEEKRYLTAAEQ